MIHHPLSLHPFTSGERRELRKQAASYIDKLKPLSFSGRGVGVRGNFVFSISRTPMKDLSIFPQYLFRESRSLLLPISKLMESIFLPFMERPFVDIPKITARKVYLNLVEANELSPGRHSHASQQRTNDRSTFLHNLSRPASYTRCRPSELLCRSSSHSGIPRLR